MATQPEETKGPQLLGRTRGTKTAATASRRPKAARATEADPGTVDVALKDVPIEPAEAEATLAAAVTAPGAPLEKAAASAEGDGGEVRELSGTDIFAIEYDLYSAADLHALLERMSRLEVEAQMTEYLPQRAKAAPGRQVERFLDVALTTSGSSNNNNNDDDGGGAEPDRFDGYNYNDMLQRIFVALNRKEGGRGMSERNELPVPEVERMGKKKVIIHNFGRICEVFKRPIEDVKDYIEKELSVGGNLDINDSLILKYEIQKVTDFDKILIKYLDEYVKCNSCHKINTTLTKEGRRMELRCNWCTATRSVQAVGSATFSAQVDKRSRTRRQAMTL